MNAAKQAQAIETLSIREVGSMLKIAPMKVKAGILNGTMPIGTVVNEAGSTKDRVIIIKKRFEAWVNAYDLGLPPQNGGID